MNQTQSPSQIREHRFAFRDLPSERHALRTNALLATDSVVNLGSNQLQLTLFVVLHLSNLRNFGVSCNTQLFESIFGHVLRSFDTAFL